MKEFQKKTVEQYQCKFSQEASHFYIFLSTITSIGYLGSKYIFLILSKKSTYPIVHVFSNLRRNMNSLEVKSHIIVSSLSLMLYPHALCLQNIVATHDLPTKHAYSRRLWHGTAPPRQWVGCRPSPSIFILTKLNFL